MWPHNQQVQSMFKMIIYLFIYLVKAPCRAGDCPEMALAALQLNICSRVQRQACSVFALMSHYFFFCDHREQTLIS